MNLSYRCLCGSEGQLVSAPREIAIGHWSATVEDNFLRCPDCGEEWYLPGQMAATQKRAAAVIREKHRIMSPERIRALRIRMGLTQISLEELLGVGPKTVTRWERGSVVPGAPVSRLLELLESDPYTAVRLRDMHKAKLSKSVPTRRATYITTVPSEGLYVYCSPYVDLEAWPSWSSAMSLTRSIPVPELNRSTRLDKQLAMEKAVA